MDTPLLDSISCPQDLKHLNDEETLALCSEIREFLIESVSQTGGHLSSNLGTIELTVALHKALSSPEDQLVFDVGHQCYTHKLLTGRKEQFAQLRKLDGLSGFPAPKESEHDAFIAGHGNTSISVAVGIARAKKLKGEPGKVVALVGDGAFTGGMIYEGMNNIGTLNNLIVLLNDNKMSISKNVGQMARYLTVLRTDPRYSRVKAHMETVLEAIPLVGSSIVNILQSCKRIVRRQLYHSTMFEEMGFQYVGPVDGNDVNALTELFHNLRDQTTPLFIHAVTVKGKGFQAAEENPGEFHGVSAFDPEHVLDPELAPKASFSTAFGKQLVELAEKDTRICAITAAMKYGTGLQFMYRRFPERFFDVGMAEQHAVTFAAGLASKGMLPVVAIYSTFLQRAYDQMIHDVKLMDLDVILAVDRAGLVPGDGETHQGIYDPVYFSQIGIPVISPCNYAELHYWLPKLILEWNGPRAIRYARGSESEVLSKLECTGQLFDVIQNKNNAKTAIVTYGSLIEDAIHAAQMMEQQGITVDVVKLVQIFPLAQNLLDCLKQYETILFAEECVAGGIGTQLGEKLLENNWHGIYRHSFVQGDLPHANVPQMKQRLGLDAEGLVKTLKGETD